MDEKKNYLQKQLVANIIRERCQSKENVIFNEAFCSQERCIRFTTAFWSKNARSVNRNGGCFQSGICVMYEVNNLQDSFSIDCVCCKSFKDKKTEEIIYKTFALLRNNQVIRNWRIENKNVNDLINRFDEWLVDDLSFFEAEINDIITQGILSEGYEEGELIEQRLTKYERNRTARQKCLEFYGFECKVCGIKFKETYGDEFSDIIEVHHTVPLSKIKSNYLVDPINDLVPVCPNCHAALHSKKDGCYTLSELKRIINE